MRLRCLHGYFIFEAQQLGQVSDFMSYTGFPLVSKGNHYTFEALEDAPEYSLAGLDLLGIPALETFEGKPWEVFEANGFVYNFLIDQVVPIESVTRVVSIEQAGNRYISNGLILPGSVTRNGDRVKGYEGWFSRDRLTWLYSEVDFV